MIGMKHAGVRVVVTGGASGIGAAIAARFIAEGARVCILDVDSKALKEMPCAAVGDSFGILCDVSDAEAVARTFAHIDAVWAGLDVVFNNAGISIREPFGEISLTSWNRVLGVNLTGVFLVAQHAARLMQRSRQGVIINTASVSGMVGMPNYLSYNVSKAGVIELTKTLALELAPDIRVNAICPGYVLTAMQRREYTESALRTCAERIPLKRLGSPSEIAAMASYLASAEAQFVTGQAFVIDGGETAGGLAS